MGVISKSNLSPIKVQKNQLTDECRQANFSVVPLIYVLLKADVQTTCNATLVCVMHRQMSRVTAWVTGESI